MTSDIHVPVSFGEIVDKITILEIKAERIEGEGKLANVVYELDALRARWEARFGPGFGNVEELAAKLRTVNLTLWTVEDEIRDCERRNDFGEHFIRLARAVYQTNDRRAAIKSEINRLLGSPLREEKSYKPYRFDQAIEGRSPGELGTEHSDDTSELAAGPAGDRRQRP